MVSMLQDKAMPFIVWPEVWRELLKGKETEIDLPSLQRTSHTSIQDFESLGVVDVVAI